MADTPFLPLKPIMMKDRISMVFLRYGQIDVKDNAFVLIDEKGERKHIPVGSIACILLEPGTRVSHAAIKLAAEVGTLLVWVGESGVRLYSSGQPGGAHADRLLYQAKLALDDELRLKVVRKMYELRFGEPAPAKRSVQQLRGIEGARVRKTYELLAQKYGVTWKRRNYDPDAWDDIDVMPLEVEHVDQLIKRQSLLVIEAARCYYIVNRGESIRDGADSLGRRVGGAGDGWVCLDYFSNGGGVGFHA